MNEPPTPAPSGVMERVAGLVTLAEKADEWRRLTAGCCEAGFALPRTGHCQRCGATADGCCRGPTHKTPVAAYNRAMGDPLPLLKELASALAEARAATLEEAIRAIGSTECRMQRKPCGNCQNCDNARHALAIRALTPAGRGDE